MAEEPWQAPRSSMSRLARGQGLGVAPAMMDYEMLTEHYMTGKPTRLLHSPPQTCNKMGKDLQPDRACTSPE